MPNFFINHLIGYLSIPTLYISHIQDTRTRVAARRPSRQKEEHFHQEPKAHDVAHEALILSSKLGVPQVFHPSVEKPQ
jgi:hypothetical protein